MSHGSEPSTGGDYDDPDAFDTMYVGLIGTFIVAAAVAVFSGVWFWIEGSAAARVVVEPNAALVAVVAEQRANLNKTGRVTRPDGEERTVMPIEDAVKQVARELQSR